MRRAEWPGIVEIVDQLERQGVTVGEPFNLLTGPRNGVALLQLCLLTIQRYMRHVANMQLVL
jgi:hypothetical protein